MKDSNLATVIKVITGGLIGLWGSLHPLVHTLLVLMALDVLSGLVAAYVTRSVSSDASWRGMAKKTLILMIVAGSEIMDAAWRLDVPIAAMVAGFYCVHEAISLMENAVRAGVPLPRALVQALRKLEEQMPPWRES